MKDIKTKNMRGVVQALVLLVLIAVITLYDLYTKGIIDFKLLGIGDLNPYGGWNALHELATDSSYVFEGISRSIGLTIALMVACIIGGRFFCGWLCPLGTVQDLFSWFGGKVKAPKYKSLKGMHFHPFILKYPILLSVLLISILGYGAMLADLSPWRALLSLSKLTSYWAEMKAGFLILAGILLASVFLSRSFCRYLCPLGAAQALFTSFSPLSLKYSKDCGSCNGCMKECPVGIRLSAEIDTISPECIRCMNCVENCRVGKDNGIHFKRGNKNASIRAYIILMLAIFTVIWLGVPQLWGGSTSDDSIALGTLKDGIYHGEAKGFAGKIITEIIVSGGKIADIKVIEHQESKGWYEEVFMILPDKIIEKQRLYVDGISGATKTSKGLVKSIENATKKAQ